ncbi:MAG: protein-glutamate O-methyltransferase CheR [Planctomycetes bacterium]|nr:protein-glutamate O-methyltransferase CheR [Planctomycetota bacterium]
MSGSLATEDFEFLRRVVLDDAGLVLDPEKTYLIDRHLVPLLRRSGHASIPALLDDLRRNPRGPLRLQVVEAMTTNETSFFRDAMVFESLRSAVIPELLRTRRASRELNLWCAACSSGQEPYSVLILLREHFPELASWRIRYVVSDLSQEMLQRTRDGIYSRLEVARGLPPALLAKYFDAHGEQSFQVKPELRRALDVRCINLVADWPQLPTMDVVMIRNVMIYFEVPTKRRILQRIKSLMARDGFLFLGTAETPRLLVDDFVRANAYGCYQLCGV